MRKKKKEGALINAQTGLPILSDAPAQRLQPARSKKKNQVLPDPYFTKLAKIARYARYAVLLMLAVFTIAVAFLYSQEITGEKLKLLLRNASFSFPGEEISFTTVRYDADRNMDYAAYRAYFAVATTAGMRLYDHRGSIALNEHVKLTSPALDAGEDYILVYDHNGKEYLVCNSVAQLYAGSEDFPIYQADVCDDGSYLIVTSSSSHLCVLKVYNRSFKISREVQIDRYPLSALYADDGSRILLLTCCLDGKGQLEGHVSLYDLSGETKLVKDLVYEQVPLGGSLLDDGFAVLFENALAFYAPDGSLRQSIPQNDAPISCAFGDGRAALTFEINAARKEYEVVLYDLAARAEIGRYTSSGRVSGTMLCCGLLFIKQENGLRAVEPIHKKEILLSGEDPVSIIEGKDGTLFFCYPDKAVNMEDAPGITDLLSAIRVQEPERNET